MGIDEHDGETKLARGIPNDANFNTGYSGRTAVFEVMVANDQIRHAISDDAPAYRVQEIAKETGMISLEDAARRKVFEKVTTVDELRRVMSDTRL